MQNNMIDWQRMNSVITVTDADENYLFSEQLQKVRERCDEITDDSDSSHSDSRNDDRLRRESILGVVGERGSGKSSFLHTVKANLTDYFVFDIVDPSAFDDSIKIVELFVSQIYKCIAEDERNANEYDDGTRNTIHQMLREITKVFADFRAGEQNFYENNSYGDVLVNIRQRVDLSTLINNLVSKFLKFQEKDKSKHTLYRGLVLCIDDVDLVSNDKIYKLLEDVRKYLAGNVIVITAFHFKQLFDAVLHAKLQENKALLESGALTVSDVQDQAARYLEKLIPVQNRIELQNISNLLTNQYFSILSALVKKTNNSPKDILKKYLSDQGLPFDSTDELTMREWLYDSLNRRIRLKLCPVDKREEVLYNLPQNLRGLLQLVRLIADEMQEVVFKEKEEDKNGGIAEALLANLQRYEAYLSRYYQEILPTEFAGRIQLWKDTDYRAKNYFICDELLRIIKTIDEEALVALPKYNLYLPYNITIGDVFLMLETYKGVAKTADKPQFFVYVLKVLYSIELLRQYLLACLGSNESLTIYLTLINAKIIYEDFGYFQSAESVANKVIFDKAVTTPEGEDLGKLYGKLFYSSVAADSDFRRAISTFTPDADKKNSKESPLRKARQFDILKYRFLNNFEIENFNDFIDTTSYLIDPFAFVGQRKYVESSLYKNMYVFYSLFDIDALVRFDYGRADSSNDKLLFRLLRKVEMILTCSLKGSSPREKFEIELAEAMSSPVFYSDEMRRLRKPIFFADSTLTDISGFADLQIKNKPIGRLSKHEFMDLIEKLLQENFLKKDERHTMEEIQMRLNNNSKSLPKKKEKETVQSICEKYNYETE